MLGIGGDLPFFFLGQPQQFRPAGTEAQLPVEPKGPGLDGFRVLMAELVGIDRDAGDTRELVEQMQYFGVDPRGFSIAICIESVEPDLHPFKQRDALDVVDGDAVLKREPGVVGPQGKAAIRCQPPGVDLYVETCFVFPYITVISAHDTLLTTIT